MSTPYRSETNGIPENAARRLKERTSSSVQSGLSEKWWGEAMECFCNLRNIQDKLTNKKSPNGRSVGPKLILILSLRKTKVVFINLVQRCFQEDSTETRYILEHVGPEA